MLQKRGTGRLISVRSRSRCNSAAQAAQHERYGRLIEQAKRDLALLEVETGKLQRQLKLASATGGGFRMKGAVRAIITKNRIGNLVQKCKAAEAAGRTDGGAEGADTGPSADAFRDPHGLQPLRAEVAELEADIAAFSGRAALERERDELLAQAAACEREATELGAELAARGEAVVSVAEARSLVADAGVAGIARLSECIARLSECGAVQPRPNYVTAGETAERLESQPASRTASEPEEESTGASSSKVSCATLPPNGSMERTV